MRAALNAITDELKRLKSTGVTSVSVSAESLAALRRIVFSRASTPEPTSPVSRPQNAPASTARPPQPAPKPAAVTNLLPAPPVVNLPEGDKRARWEALRDQVLGNSTCLANLRPGKKVVFGVGSLDAKIMFVGEAPEAEEEIEGMPFVGPAGQLLTKMIVAMGLKRDYVYICNVMSWRPQTPTPEGLEQVGDRLPTNEEMAFCLPFLKAQIEVVNPVLIVALGASAARALLGAGSFKTLGDVRGQWKVLADKPVIVTYHPSYLLRQEVSGPAAARKAKRATWEDLLKVMDRAGLTITDKQRGFFTDK